MKHQLTLAILFLRFSVAAIPIDSYHCQKEIMCHPWITGEWLNDALTTKHSWEAALMCLYSYTLHHSACCFHNWCERQLLRILMSQSPWATKNSTRTVIHEYRVYDGRYAKFDPLLLFLKAHTQQNENFNWHGHMLSQCPACTINTVLQAYFWSLLLHLPPKLHLQHVYLT